LVEFSGLFTENGFYQHPKKKFTVFPATQILSKSIQTSISAECADNSQHLYKANYLTTTHLKRTIDT
jgi:hypothetical protein